jgi:hypothetical protein
MVKTLLNQFGKRVRNTLCLLGTVVSLAGCPNPFIQGEPSSINYAPKVIVSSSKPSGNIGLSIKEGESVSLKLNWEDDNGIGDIVDYQAGIDTNEDEKIDEGLVQQPSPIANYSWTSTKAGPYKFIAQCTDAEGLIGTAKLEILVVEPEPIEPEPIKPEPIEPEPVEPVPEPICPVVDFGELNTELIDGRTSIIELPFPTDADTIGEIPYINVEVLGGNIIPTLNGRQLTLSANPVSEDTPYQIRLTFGSNEGGINTATLEGVVKNLCDISGRLQDNETDTDRAGFIVVRNKIDNSIIETYNVNGAFSFTLPKKVSELPDGIVLEARLGTEENPTSYKRRIELPAGNHNPITDPRGNPAIRVVPYDNPDDPYDDGLLDTEEKRNNFIEHMGRVNFWGVEDRIDNTYFNDDDGDGIAETGEVEQINGNSNNGNKKWNLGELLDTLAHPILRGMKISKGIPNYEQIKSAIQEESDILIVEEDNPTRERGWITIFPSPKGEGPYAKLYDQTGSDGYLEFAEVYLNTTDKRVVIHEAAYHGEMACAGHSNSPKVPALFDSIGEYTSTPTSPNKLMSIDKKANHIVDEPTNLGMEKLDDIL